MTLQDKKLFELVYGYFLAMPMKSQRGFQALTLRTLKESLLKGRPAENSRRLQVAEMAISLAIRDSQ